MGFCNIGFVDIVRHQCFDLLAQTFLRTFFDSAAAILAVRIQPRFEQLDQQTRDQRIAVERFFHVRLRKRHARLQQVFAQAAQHGNLARFELRRQHELVEAVALDFATPHRFEAGFETIAHVRQIEIHRRTGAHFEIVHGQRAAVLLQRVHVLGQHLQAHVFQHRQRVGQRNRFAEMDHLEAQTAVAGSS